MSETEMTPDDLRLLIADHAYLSQRNRELEAQLKQAASVPEDWISVVQWAYDELCIIDESEGITGWHLNGAVSPWHEGELPEVRKALKALLDATPTRADESLQSGADNAG